MRIGRATGLMLCVLSGTTGPSAAATEAARPDVLVISIDTLRADRLSSYGYHRPTSPNLDRLIGEGVKFTQARTVEPLTAPALCSMFTSLSPHVHGATRNGLRMRSGLASLPKLLREQGYRTAAFVGNWTLRDKLSGLAEHFEQYEELLNRKRWIFVSGESSADDITRGAIGWLTDHARGSQRRPFLLWVHYVEPHAPYKLHPEHLSDLGLKAGKLTPADRYDTEIAYTDRSIGELLQATAKLGLLDHTLVVLISDHGESLGEHNYWGHGRHLNEPNLRIPLSLTWAGRLKPQTIDAPALNIDIPPTVLGLLGLPMTPGFEGYDWSGVLHGGEPPADRVTHYQAHKGAVLAGHDSDASRRSGLLEVAQLRRQRKEVFRIENGRHLVFDLGADPRESVDLTAAKTEPSKVLEDWLRVVYSALNRCDEQPMEPPDPETIEQLRTLGYAD